MMEASTFMTMFRLLLMREANDSMVLRENIEINAAHVHRLLDLDEHILEENPDPPRKASHTRPRMIFSSVSSLLLSEEEKYTSDFSMSMSCSSSEFFMERRSSFSIILVVRSICFRYCKIARGDAEHEVKDEMRFQVRLHAAHDALCKFIENRAFARGNGDHILFRENDAERVVAYVIS